MSTRRTGIGQALSGLSGSLEERRRQRELERSGQTGPADGDPAVRSTGGAEASEAPAADKGEAPSPAGTAAAERGRSGTGALFASQRLGLQQQVEDLQKQLLEAGARMIPAESIRRSRYYNRYELDLVDEDASFKSLLDSVRASKGNVVPVLVRGDDGSGYELVYGHRRWAASKIAGTPVLAYVRTDLTEELAAQLQILENSERKTPSILDRALQIESHLSSGAWPGQQALADSLGMAQSYVSMLMGIAKHIPKTLQMAHPDHHKITYIQAKQLAQVAQKEPEELKRRIEWVRKNKSQLSGEEATQHLLRGKVEEAPQTQRVVFTMTKNSLTLKARGLTTARAAELEQKIKELLQTMGLAADVD